MPPNKRMELTGKSVTRLAKRRERLAPPLPEADGSLGENPESPQLSRSVRWPKHQEHEERRKYMPIVRIDIWSGKNQEIKKNLAKEITDVMVKNVGCPTEAVTIIFEEIPKQNWVIGGQFCSDIFKDVP